MVLKKISIELKEIVQALTMLENKVNQPTFNKFKINSPEECYMHLKYRLCFLSMYISDYSPYGEAHWLINYNYNIINTQLVEDIMKNEHATNYEEFLSIFIKRLKDITELENYSDIYIMIPILIFKEIIRNLNTNSLLYNIFYFISSKVFISEYKFYKKLGYDFKDCIEIEDFKEYLQKCIPKYAVSYKSNPGSSRYFAFSSHDKTLCYNITKTQFNYKLNPLQIMVGNLFNTIHEISHLQRMIIDGDGISSFHSPIIKFNQSPDMRMDIGEFVEYVIFGVNYNKIYYGLHLLSDEECVLLLNPQYWISEELQEVRGIITRMLMKISNIIQAMKEEKGNTISKANPFYVNPFGYDEEDVNKELKSLLPPDTPPIFKANCLELFSSIKYDPSRHYTEVQAFDMYENLKQLSQERNYAWNDIRSAVEVILFRK
jgi:hypothetical protein